ncbi:aspartate aminotransferase family protein [Candidatus Aerophobetes bacterium]|uniref:Acetylornithine aminotransferase n=1 Tax=Aerophobetes bacterium TaxID=2030807 RepID=A0A523TB76_UNCAE|nr:MAG: aspartate aminotransferase family protein [Candidatus Aerophobetes bacterium]
MDTQMAMQMDKKYVMQSYSRIPLVIDKGKGVRVWDKEGREYLDFISGIGVNAIGHCHPEILRALTHQAKRLLHCSNLYYIEPQANLARALCEVSFADKVFFSNSGAEANEAAIKLARRWGKGKRYEIITMKESFHGRTLTTLRATAQTKYQKGFGPFPPGFKYSPFNDLERLKERVSEKTCAIMLEPIQGEGGIRMASEDFMEGVWEICRGKRILLILDEIQCGLGRTGKMFAYQHYGIEPDIMTLAKPLAGGLPMGATLAKEEVASLFKPGDHASTFGGNPLVSSAALAFLKVMEEENLVKKAEERGEYFGERLKELKAKYSFIKEIRGKGLMRGIELEFEGKGVVEKCRYQGLLINCTAKKVLRFLPPLTVKEEEIDQAVDILQGAFEELGQGGK